MKILEGKTPSEKKKLIAALVLGSLAVLLLFYNLSGILFGSRKTTVSVNISPTPTATVNSSSGTQTSSNIQLLTPDEVNAVWLTTPVVYAPSSFYAPDAGRNIFAFYEPPAPTPYESVMVIATPKITPTPTPPPPPPIYLGYVSPQSIYAGSRSFRLEVNGDKFTPDSMILWNGSQIPTNFVNAQKLTADISANLIAGEGQRSVEIRTPDGKLYSNPVMLNVQAPPRPTVQYVAVELARRGNNNVAYFREPGNPIEYGRRLSDIVNPNTVNNRFRVVSISGNEVILEDTNLGFRHKLAILRPNNGAGGGGGQTTPTRGGFDRTTPGGRFPTENTTTVVPYNPTLPQTQEIPGIPNNIPRYVPPTPQKQQQQKKDDDDDDEDGDN